MSCLTDTHVLLWALSSDSRLGPRARALIEEPPAWVSSISLLEIEIKRMLGKLDAPRDLERQLQAEHWHLTAFEAAHATAISSFSTLVRHDPFDRALLAQAQVERMTFVTADRALLDLGLSWVHDART